MAINPQIPLMARPQIDPTPGLGQLANAIQYTQQREDKAATAEREEKLFDLKMRQFESQMADQGRTRSMEEYAHTVDRVHSLMAAGLDDVALESVLQHRNNMLEMSKTNPNINAQHSDFFLKVFEQDREKAMKMVDTERRLLSRRGLIKGGSFEQGKGDMEGYVFDKDSGTFSIDPELKKSLDADAAEKKKEEGLLDPNQIAGVNDKVTTLTKGVRDAWEAASALDALKKRGTPAAKIGAIFKFMKALDPTSTVRESEGRMIMEAEGAMKGFAQRVNELLGEGPLSEANFADLVDTSKIIANDAIGSAQRSVDGYLEVLDDKLTPEDLDQLRARVPTSFEVEPPKASLSEGDEMPDGTIIQVPVPGGGTKRQILRNGEWVDVQE
jgi:hypothetical protein